LTIDWIAEKSNFAQITPRSFYHNLSDEFQHPYDGFTSIGLTIDDYFENVSYKITPATFVENNRSLDNIFSEVGSEIVIASLAPHSYIRQMTDAIGISEHISAIYNPYQDANSHSKYSIYKQFSDEDVLVTGDSYARDIQPAIELGFDTVHLAPDCSISDAYTCIDHIEEIENHII
jgi:phosphoglycolate phosphatase-like HAD superfamily hydrolase